MTETASIDPPSRSLQVERLRSRNRCTVDDYQLHGANRTIRRRLICLATLATFEVCVTMSSAMSQTSGKQTGSAVSYYGRPEPDEQIDLTIGTQKLRLPAAFFNFTAVQLDQIRRNQFPPVPGISISFCWPELRPNRTFGPRDVDCHHSRAVFILDLRFGDDRNPDRQPEKSLAGAMKAAVRSKLRVDDLPPEEQEAAAQFYRATGIKWLSKSVGAGVGSTPDSQKVTTFVRVKMYPDQEKLLNVKQRTVHINLIGWVESKNKTYNYLFRTGGATKIDDWPNVFDRIDALISSWISAATTKSEPPKQ